MAPVHDALGVVEVPSCAPEQEDEALQSLLNTLLDGIGAKAMLSLPAGWDKESALQRLSEHLKLVDAELDKKQQGVKVLEEELARLPAAEVTLEDSDVAGGTLHLTPRAESTASGLARVDCASSATAERAEPVEPAEPAQPAMPAEPAEPVTARAKVPPVAMLPGRAVQGGDAVMSSPRMCQSQLPFSADASRRRQVPVPSGSASSSAMASASPSSSSVAGIAGMASASARTYSPSPTRVLRPVSPPMHQQQLHRLASAPLGWQRQVYGNTVASPCVQPQQQQQQQQQQLQRLASAPCGWRGDQIYASQVPYAQQRAPSPHHLGGISVVSSAMASSLRGSSPSAPSAKVRSGSAGPPGTQTPMLLRGSCGGTSTPGAPRGRMVLAGVPGRDASPCGGASGCMSPPLPGTGPAQLMQTHSSSAGLGASAKHAGRFAVVPPSSAHQQPSWSPPVSTAASQAASRFILVSPAASVSAEARSSSVRRN